MKLVLSLTLLISSFSWGVVPNCNPISVRNINVKCSNGHTINVYNYTAPKSQKEMRTYCQSQGGFLGLIDNGGNTSIANNNPLCNVGVAPGGEIATAEVPNDEPIGVEVQTQIPGQGGN